MSIERDNQVESSLPGFRGEIDEFIKFRTNIINCNGDTEKIVVEVEHIIKAGKSGGWSDVYTSKDKISECVSSHIPKTAKIKCEIVVGTTII